MQNANPLRATLAAISLGEVLDSFDWTDSSAFTATHSPRIEGYFKRDSSTSSSVMYRIRDAFRKDSSDVFANALSTFYECISTHRNVVYDQVTYLELRSSVYKSIALYIRRYTIHVICTDIVYLHYCCDIDHSVDSNGGVATLLQGQCAWCHIQ
jgi:hypothetical protein